MNGLDFVTIIIIFKEIFFFLNSVNSILFSRIINSHDILGSPSYTIWIKKDKNFD